MVTDEDLANELRWLVAIIRSHGVRQETSCNPHGECDCLETNVQSAERLIIQYDEERYGLG